MKTIELPQMPVSWNEMSTEQMERIIGLYDRNLSENTFLCLAFLKIINLKVLKRVINDNKVNSTYLLRHRGFLPWIKRESIPVQSWQIHSWSNKYLGFLLKECNRMTSPYPTIKLRGILYKGPGDCLADFSWHQYKWAQDHLTLFRKQQEVLKWLVNNNGSGKAIKNCVLQCNMYRNNFLSALFTPGHNQVNAQTGKREKVFVYNQDQTEKNHRRFSRITDKQFKVILLFWDGCMAYFQHTFPHLFKAGDGGKANTDMLKMEAINMVTLVDRLKCTSQQVYSEPAVFVLETLERISNEAAEMKKMQDKMKK